MFPDIEDPDEFTDEISWNLPGWMRYSQVMPTKRSTGKSASASKPAKRATKTKTKAK